MATTDDRIAALEAMVADLRAQLERRPRRDSMSKTLTCPCCGGGALLGIRRIDERVDSGLVPLAIGNRPGFWSSKSGAPLQAYICRSCRLVEWHVASLDALEPDGEIIIEIDRPVEGAPDAGPYR